jgi:hypothetical protein
MTQYERSYQIDYFCGWRYLFSAKFRDRVKQKWGNNLMLRSLFLIGSFTGMLLTSAAAILLIMAIWHLAS